MYALRPATALAAALLLSASAAAAPDAVENRLRAHVEILASDDWEGRNAGQPGSELAAAYIAAFFEDLGLKGVGVDGGYYQPFTFDVRGAQEKAETVNVVGLLEGSDPALKDELVIIGGHYDHVGRGHHPDAGRIGKAATDDDIWNGADDNASGTSCVMEVARLLAAGPRPARSVLFMLFGAEEHGLLGSIHYNAHPLFPLQKTVAMINMDMVGRNPEEAVSVSGLGSGGQRVFDELLDDAQREVKDLRLDRMNFTLPGGSDHLPFLQKKVPTIFVSTGLHADYHRVTDHADLLAYDNMARITRMVTTLAKGLGAGDRMDWSYGVLNPLPTLGKMALRGIGAPVFLGALSAESTEDGVAVGRMWKGSPGYRAGLRDGDTITAAEGQALAGDGGLEALRAGLKEADRYGTTKLTIERDGEEYDLVVVWRG